MSTTEPRVVSPQEAQREADAWARTTGLDHADVLARDYAHTVATEPERTRAAIVKALRDEAHRIESGALQQTAWTVRNRLRQHADVIENGGDR